MRYAIGDILTQGIIGKYLYTITYISRLLNKEQNYSVTEKESLAIVYSVQFFRPYIYKIYISYGPSTSEMVAFSKKPCVKSHLMAI